VVRPHEEPGEPDAGGCAGYGCCGCFAAYLVAVALLLWLVYRIA